MSFFSSLLFLLQNLDYTHNTHFYICKFIFYAINNVLNENIIIFYYSLRPTLFVFGLFEKLNFLREHHLLSCLHFKNV